MNFHKVETNSTNDLLTISLKNSPPHAPDGKENVLDHLQQRPFQVAASASFYFRPQFPGGNGEDEAAQDW